VAKTIKGVFLKNFFFLSFLLFISLPNLSKGFVASKPVKTNYITPANSIAHNFDCSFASAIPMVVFKTKSETRSKACTEKVEARTTKR
jgi:hypothetical protein